MFQSTGVPRRQRWVFALVLRASLVVEQDARTLTTGAICFPAAVCSTPHCDPPTYWKYLLVDLELNDNDLGLLREIGESNRAASSRGQSIEQVATWRASVEV